MKRRKDVLAQRDTKKREHYKGDGNGKNIFTKDNKGNEIVASASELLALPGLFNYVRVIDIRRFYLCPKFFLPADAYIA